MSLTSSQRGYLAITTGLSCLGLTAVAVQVSRSSLTIERTFLLVLFSVLYGLACYVAVELETPTERSPSLVSIEDAPLLAALLLVGPAAVPALILADAVARLASRGLRQPLGYLFNLNSLTFVSVMMLAVSQVLLGHDIGRLAAFPSGALVGALLVLTYLICSQGYHALLTAIGSEVPVITVVQRELRRTLWITPIPAAIGVICAALYHLAPGLLALMLVPSILSYFALRAVAEWVTMLHQIEDARQNLERRVTEATAELQASNAALRAAEERFFAGVMHATHDSTSIVNRILSIMGRTRQSPEERLRVSAAAIQRLRDQQANVLEGARLRYSNLPVVLSDVDLVELVSDTVASHIPDAEELGVQITLAPEPIGLVRSDANYLRRVIDNLLANAVKFTAYAQERRVTVELSLEEDVPSMIRVVVRDTGIGIDPETLARLGAMCVRAQAGDRSYLGYGIGIAGSVVLMDALGGSLSIDSAGVGRGATVTCLIPRAEAHDDEPEDSTHDPAG